MEQVMGTIIAAKDNMCTEHTTHTRTHATVRIDRVKYIVERMGDRKQSRRTKYIFLQFHSLIFNNLIIANVV